MSITYEEALGTLTAMFTDPWDEDSLDTVLRHFEGHMENTVDAVLAHGDSPPADLLKRFEASSTGASIADMDAQLARQLAEQEEARQQHAAAAVNNARSNRSATPVATNVAPGWRRDQNAITSMPPQAVAADLPVSAQKKGRGILTHLPPDFLRIPGSGANNMSSDEALARMLQDKLFAEEIKNNPEFAHLARGGGGAARAHGAGRPGQQRANHNSEPPMLKALQGMGEQAKKRFQDLAAKVKQKVEQQKNNHNNAAFASTGATGGGAAERRGLLDIHEDDDEQEISFVNNGTHEMRSMDAGFAYGKKDD